MQMRERRDFTAPHKETPKRVWKLSEYEDLEGNPKVRLLLEVWGRGRVFTRVVAELDGGGVHLIAMRDEVPEWATAAGHPPETTHYSADGYVSIMAYGVKYPKAIKAPSKIETFSYDDCDGDYEGPEPVPRGRQIVSDEILDEACRRADEEEYFRGKHPGGEAQEEDFY